MKKIWQTSLVSLSRFAVEKKKKKKIMATAKFFALHANSTRSQWGLKRLSSEPRTCLRENENKVKEAFLKFFHQESFFVMLYCGKNFGELDLYSQKQP